MKRSGAGRRRAQGKPVGKRRRAREMAVQMLYQLELGGSPQDEVFRRFDLDDFVRETENPLADDADVSPPAAGTGTAETSAAGASARECDVKSAFEYAQTLVSGVLENGESIDSRIRRHAENWRLERMPMIDRNILRVAIFEMLYKDGVPKVVIVDEAIELAKKFGAENSSRFVNGLLDGVLKASRQESCEETGAAVAEKASGGTAT